MPRALSNRKCVGLWQFAQFRGKEYGLTQTPSTDERMDPEKATRAAARHLRDLYQHFGDWYLAMAAYDCGPACVDRAVMRTGYADFFQLRRMNALPKETQNYVPVILAMTIIGKNAAAYGVEFDYDHPLEFETLKVSTPTHLALIADAVDRPISELKELNPAILKSVAPSGFSIHVPKGTLPAVEAAFNVIPEGKRDSWRLHRLESGDTFTALAKRYSASALNISAVNHDELPGMGALLAIPSPYPGEKAARTAPVKSSKKAVSRKAPQVPAAASRKAPAPKKAALGSKGTTKPPVRRAALSHGHNS
jgi:membrane-bound lytic murein transglycosylase D